MAVYGTSGLVDLVKEGRLEIGNATTQFGEWSQDLRIGTLWRKPRGVAIPVARRGRNRGRVVSKGHMLTAEEICMDYLEEVDISQGHLVGPTDTGFYMLPKEWVSLDAGLQAEVVMRSRSARHGLHIRSLGWGPVSIHDNDRPIENQLPLCKLKTWTRYVVHEGESVCQLVVSDGYQDVLPPEEMRKLMMTGEMRVSKKIGRKTKSKPRDLKLKYNHGLLLHRGNDMKRYVRKLVDGDWQGLVVDPRKPLEAERAFKHRMLRGTVTTIPGDFILTSCRENIEKVPDGYVMYVVAHNKDRMYEWVGAGSGGYQFLGPSHPNAPYVIQPGAITFENHFKSIKELRRGQYQSELFLIPLVGEVDLEKMRSSRFRGQKGPRTHAGNGKI